MAELTSTQPSGHASTRARYRRIVFLTWFLTLDLIMFGAFVRLTDSGLGCPDWPGCYGSVTPIGALDSIREAVNAMPDGPVTLPKAWIEMIHRYVGALLGFLIMLIVALGWRNRSVLGYSPKLAIATLVAVCIQGAFGAWTVTHQLMPAVVTAHLFGGMTLLGMMTWLAARERTYAKPAAATLTYLPWAIFGLLLLAVQIVLGGWVSTNYAALACMDFPTCHGSWIPDMDMRNGFSVVRGLGEMPNGEMISQTALTAIHWAHRNFAFVVFAVLGILAWRLLSDQGTRGPARLVLVLLGAQLFTGLTTIFFHWPLLIAVLHNGGAAGLLLATVTIVYRLSVRSGAAQPVQSR